MSFHCGELRLMRADTSRPPRRVRRMGFKETLVCIPMIDA